MDWKSLAERFEPATCVISVEEKPGGGPGTIRIVNANEKYIDALALAAGGVALDSDKKTEFVPNSEYTRYIPKDLNFEDVCYRAAILKQPMRNCVRASRYPFDIMAYLMPMESGGDRLGYCTFTQVLVPKSDNNLMNLNISQETAMEVINTCIKLRDDKPFGEIMQAVVEETRSICEAYYCSVLLLDESQRKVTVMGEAYAPGAAMRSKGANRAEGFYDLAETWLDTMAGSFCLVIRDADDMEYVRERNPRWYQSMVDGGIERLVLFPLIPRGQFLGYIMAVNFDTENVEHIKETLELTSFFIASEIANNRYIDMLQQMNKTDALTGVMNRNAMNNRVAELSDAAAGQSSGMGVVFADMNGLKNVNDSQGHAAGDQLLKNAAVILQSTFVGDEIYRTGGDEFLVLMQETDEDDIRRKIAEIKQKSALFSNVSFSVGYSFLADGRDIRKALSEADARMYEDKEDCYRTHPEMKRRQ